MGEGSTQTLPVNRTRAASDSAGFPVGEIREAERERCEV